MMTPDLRSAVAPAAFHPVPLTTEFKLHQSTISQDVEENQ